MSGKPKTANELREAFLKYFESKGHTRVRSSSLIPHNDPTLLFTNAGMNQFKDLFTGKETRSYKRATTCQKCVRAGGKHNDLESVGFTKRHHTFFEMLGNFSFGDYFKEDAIKFGWEFLTEVVGLPKDKLWVSIFEEDDEAEKLWLKISGLPKERIVRMGEKDNFWAMGDTGPCGPCSEIYIDRGESFSTKKNETIFDGGERFLEIWNLVFMQYERFADGKMIPLPKPSVDTGMGLERLASVVQNADSNYLTDSLQNILQSFAKLIGKPYGKNAEDDTAYRVLTDHIRAVSFLIADGVQPSNEGRGYVLRRILRRAIRYGKKLGCSKPFFHHGVDFVEKEMSAAYPELTANKAAVKNIIFHEEEKFFETLETGLKLLDQKTQDLKKGGTLSGAVAFQLYDTYGFPLDLTEVILKEKGFTLDQKGFEEELEKQRDRSRASWKGSGEEGVQEFYKQLHSEGLKTEFTGYDYEPDAKGEAPYVTGTISRIIQNGKVVSSVKEGESAEIVLEKTPFYAEGGGQMGDTGRLESENGSIFEVENTVKPTGSFHLHQGKVIKGSFKTNESVHTDLDLKRRMKIRINHTITHVLHATLQEVLGEHIKQAGSLVHPDYLRFDFSHFKALTKEEKRKIEKVVNERIIENTTASPNVQSLEEAIKSGAKAFFEDKYGDTVRVLSIGKFSKELCGGTHAKSLGEAGLFKIVSESSVASGVRRIVAVTGAKAYELTLEQEETLDHLADLLKSPEKEVVNRVEKLLKEKNELQKKLQNASAQSSASTEQIQSIEGVNAFVQIVKVEDAKDLRPLSDRLKQKLKTGLVVLGADISGRATVIVSVTDDIAKDFSMPKFIESLSKTLGVKGGGKANFAQVGGPSTPNLNDQKLLELTKEHIRSLQLSA